MKFGIIAEGHDAGNTDYVEYSEELRHNVKIKIASLIPEKYRDKIAYAIAIEETEAWIVPLFEQNRKTDTSSHTKPKEHLERLLSKDDKLKKKYIDTGKKRPDAKELGKLLAKKLGTCRSRNKSLDLFCLEVESLESQE